MPAIQDYSLSLGEDVSIAIDMNPQTSISGWTIQYQLTKRFGGTSGLITRSMASGFVGTSGMDLVNGTTGRMTVKLDHGSPLLSGVFGYGNYAYKVERLDSGFHKVITEGFETINP